MVEIYEKQCPYCGKKISSLSKNQFDYNFEQHVVACKRKQEKKNLNHLNQKKGAEDG